MIFGLSEPLILMLVIIAVVAIIKLIPFLQQKASELDYNNFPIKYSNGFNHYLGKGGSGFQGRKMSKAPVDHGNYRATLYLEGLPKPICDANINPDDPDKDYKILETTDLLAGTRVDVFWKIDANGIHHDWANMSVEDMASYKERIAQDIESGILTKKMRDKEIEESLKNDPVVQVVKK